jgi:hypothetical protein
MGAAVFNRHPDCKSGKDQTTVEITEEAGEWDCMDESGSTHFIVNL